MTATIRPCTTTVDLFESSTRTPAAHPAGSLLELVLS